MEKPDRIASVDRSVTYGLPSGIQMMLIQDIVSISILSIVFLKDVPFLLPTIYLTRLGVTLT